MASAQKLKQLVDEGAIGQVKAAWCRHFIAYGGDVRQYHVDHLGTVVAFNRNGHPVLTLDRPPTQNPAKTTITDRYDCARVIDDAGSLIRTNGHSAVLV